MTRSHTQARPRTQEGHLLHHYRPPPPSLPPSIVATTTAAIANLPPTPRSSPSSHVQRLYTREVITLGYRPPEILLGAGDFSIDLTETENRPTYGPQVRVHSSWLCNLLPSTGYVLSPPLFILVTTNDQNLMMILGLVRYTGGPVVTRLHNG